MVTEVKKRYAASRKFLEVGLKSRVLVATLTSLHINSLDETPDETVLPCDLQNASKPDKKRYLSNLAGTVVDNFVRNKETVAQALQAKVDLEEQISKLIKTTDGKFKCQEPTCTKTFQYNGKRKRDHQQKVHGIVRTVVTKAFNDTDDMFNYQCSLLEYLMLLRNFTDAVSEADGTRIIRCWKFLLLYLKADGASSWKYCLEGLYLLCQINCLLSQREAYRLV